VAGGFLPAWPRETGGRWKCRAPAPLENVVRYDTDMSAITVQLPQRLSYPIEEGAALLGISKHTLIRDIRRGHVKTTRYGKRILIPFAELQRLAAEGMRPEPRPAA